MSGSTIGSFVGAGIGFFVGGPTGAKWGWMIGGAIGGIVDPDVIKGPRLENAQAQTSNEGIPRPLIYGKAAVQGNIIQCGDLIEHKQREGGKGGGPVQETFTYTRTVAIRICEAAPLGGEFILSRVWMNDKLVYDRTGTGTVDAESSKFASILTFYSGSETQLPDPSLEALPAERGGGAGNVPAYRGTCYAVLRDLDCTETGGAVHQFRWEVASCGSVTGAGDTPRPFDWMVLGSDTPNNLAVSTDPSSFVDSFSPGAGSTSTVVLTIGDRIIIGNRKSDDFGVTWQTLANWPVNVSAGVLTESGRLVLVSASAQAVYYSDDAADSFTSVSVSGFGTGPGGVACDGSNVIIYSAIQNRLSVDDGDSFGSLRSNLTSFGKSSIEAVGAHNGLWVAAGGGASPSDFGWSDDNGVTGHAGESFAGGITGAAKCVLYVDGIGWIVQHANNTTGTSTHFHFSANGKTGWTNATTPSIKTDPFGQNGIAASGGVCVSACESAGGFGAIYTTDGTTWLASTIGGTVNTGGQSGAVAVFGAAVYAGIAIPDAPGYYFDRTTGETNGPSIGTVDPCVITLDEIVGDLTERGSVLDYDVTALASDVVLGYPINSPTSAAGAIKSLQQVYFFDYPEWGNSGDTTTMLRAVKRGGANKWTLTDDDLVDFDDNETRAQAVEFPRKVNLIAASPDANYQPIKQTAERESENVRAIGEMTIDTPVCFNRDAQAQTVEILMKTTWEEANGRAEVQVPEEYTRFVTSDCGTYAGKRWRIEKITAEDGVSTWDLVRDRASAYISTALGSDALAPTAAASSMRGPTMFAAMNLPRLRSQDSTPGMYIAVCGLMPAWAGCDLYLSVDGGVTEQKVVTLIDPAVMGELTASLAIGGATLSVDLYDGEVEDVTDAQLAARQNAAAVTTGGTSEVLQFKEATQTDTLADLTDLRRGLIGTTEDDHVDGDSFVVLDSSVVLLPIDISLAGTTLIFRPVTRGTVPANNPTYSVVYSPLFTGPQVVEPYTDDAGNTYTDDAGNIYYYEVTP